MSELPLDGEVFGIAYPFVRAVYTDLDEDGYADRPTWNPGVRFENVGPEDVEAVADGTGRCQFTVVSTHKPGRFPTRVFFTRRFIDPDGNEFGKGKLHMCTAEKFRRLIKGYQHDFVIYPADEAAA